MKFEQALEYLNKGNMVRNKEFEFKKDGDAMVFTKGNPFGALSLLKRFFGSDWEVKVNGEWIK